MKKDLLKSVTYQNVVKCWLTGVLVVLPFQRSISKGIAFVWDSIQSDYIVSFINILDELTILICILFVINEYFKGRDKFGFIHLALLVPFLLFCIAGLITGIVNSNNFYATALGTFDYIKNFLVIFIYAIFFRELYEFKRTFRILLITAVIVGFVALLQESWALIGRYIIGINFNDKASIFLGMYHMSENVWRFGLFRAQSLIHNSSIMGLYCLLILVMYIYLNKKISSPFFLALFSGIFTSLSRVVYAGFIFFAGVQFLKGRKWLIIMVVPFIIILFYMSTLKDFKVLEMSNTSNFNRADMVQQGDEDNSYNRDDDDDLFEDHLYFREYTKKKAFEIWKDYPLWGIGPGMFGGIISIKTHSYYYGLYNFSPHAVNLVNRWSGIDQFWPQLIAETGIIGTACFVFLFLSLLILFQLSKRRATLSELKEILDGLSVIAILILIYTLGSGLNITAVLFTYCAVAGMGLGIASKE